MFALLALLFFSIDLKKLIADIMYIISIGISILGSEFVPIKTLQ